MGVAYASGREDAGGALRALDGAGRGLGGLGDLVRGGRGRSRRAPRRGGQEAGPRNPLPCVRRPLRRARHSRAHLASPRRLAVRDLRALRRAPHGLPRARREDRARALGGSPELAPRGPPRGPGARGPHAGPGRRGGGRGARRGRPQALGHARARGRAGQGVGRLLGRQARRHRRDQPAGWPHPHTRHARPRRQEVRTARPTEATGRRSPRSPATCRAPSPRRLRGDAAGDADRRPLPRDAALLEGDRSRQVPRAQGVRREARGARAHQVRVAQARGEPGGAPAGGAREDLPPTGATSRPRGPAR